MTDAPLREALKSAVNHIEHMTAWIANANTDYHCGVYSLESIGEDMPGIRAALAQSLPGSDGTARDVLRSICKAGGDLGCSCAGREALALPRAEREVGS